MLAADKFTRAMRTEKKGKKRKGRRPEFSLLEKGKGDSPQLGRPVSDHNK